MKKLEIGRLVFSQSDVKAMAMWPEFIASSARLPMLGEGRMFQVKYKCHIEFLLPEPLMELVEDRHAKRATIIASQLPVASWYDIIGEATIADAIPDRLIHAAHRIKLKGESLRKKR